MPVANDRLLQARAAPGNRKMFRPHSVREVIASREPITGRSVPWTLAPRRAGDPAVLYASAHKAQSELHWTPRYAELDAIVGTAWNWHRAHPKGFGDK